MHDPFLHASLSQAQAQAQARSRSPSAAEDETLPERAPPGRETARDGRGEVVVQLLADVRRSLQGTPEGKARRMMLRKLESLQFVVDCWGAIPPRPGQVSAMLETLLKLQQAAHEARALTG